jgi:transposase
MMGKDTVFQTKFMFVNLDDFIPQNHLLRTIREVIDFDFIYCKVASLYSQVGRRSIDPVLLIKMLLLGYLYGIPSERKLEQEIQLNLAYRWFLGLDLCDPVPDHSTLSQNRRRRFKNSGIFQEIFDTIVFRCIEQGLVTGEVIVTDSTHIKASASKTKVEIITVEKTPSDYLLELEQEARQLENEINAKRQSEGKKKSGKKPKDKESVVVKVVRSTTDADAGLLGRIGKPDGFHYLGHTSIDTKHGIITDIYVTPGNLNDHTPYIKRLKVQKEKWKLNIQNVGVDRGYDYPEIHYGLEKLHIQGYIPPTKRNGGSSATPKTEFNYCNTTDTYTCPEGKILSFSHVQLGDKFYKVYAAKAKDCKSCQCRAACFSKNTKFRTLKVNFCQKVIDRNRKLCKTTDYRKIQRLRRIWCEGTFGTLKSCHNLRMTYKRGLENVQEQCLLSALAINLKRMVKALAS